LPQYRLADTDDKDALAARAAKLEGLVLFGRRRYQCPLWWPWGCFGKKYRREFCRRRTDYWAVGMHNKPSDEIVDLRLRRRVWHERRQEMEARPSGKPWRGRVRGNLYGTARFVHNVLRPTYPLRFGAKRALMLELSELTLAYPDLPAGFDGYRVLHLTDLHLDNIEDTAAATAEIVAGIEAHLCVITGDIRDNVHAPLTPLIDRLEQVVLAVRAPDGVLGILGNHDSAGMVPSMENIGVRMLLNETVSLARGMDVLHVTGLDDVHRFYTEAAPAALEAAPQGFCIALVHSPEIADRASIRHRLYLTGHTHGGQICLPGRRPLATGLKRHRELASGVWRHGDMLGYTSRGIGACVLPFRTFCPGEVTLVTLQRGPAHVSLDGCVIEL
jgi:predicted MPP superfamily phosphohydrolase